ncbi:MAG: phosphoribosyltransferase family protein, partial [Anaerovoracaceae bacterium]|nr:phosphoribosyltransferase family protein [Anaerovoracaceae bacterium]
MKVKAEIMSQDQMRRALKRMSHEILERNSGAANIVLIGILRRGKPLAETIRDNILQIEGVEVPVAELDVSSFRDDISELVDRKDYLQPALDIEGKDIVLVDDVIYTGRTTRA